MEKIQIETQLTFKEYAIFLYKETYKKPVVIFITFIGLLMLVLSTLYFLGLYHNIDEPPYFQLIFGLFVSVLIPFSVYRSAKKTFTSSQRLKEKISYEFDPEKIKISGESFHSEMDWPQTHKIVELKDWILIYHNALIANVIPKRAFNDKDLNNFKELVRGMPDVKSKLKK